MDISLRVKVPPLNPPTNTDSTLVYSISLLSLLGESEAGVMVKSHVMSPTSSDG